MELKIIWMAIVMTVISTQMDGSHGVVLESPWLQVVRKGLHCFNRVLWPKRSEIRLSTNDGRSQKSPLDSPSLNVPLPSRAVTPETLARRRSNLTGVYPPPASPPLIDWRKHSSYPNVRNQDEFGYCEASWAFSPVSAVEILYSRIHNKQTYFSKQQVIDCCPDTNGCYGGNGLRTLKYMMNVGVTLENTYPVIGKKSSCNSNVPIVAKVESFIRVPVREKHIVQALEHSPLMVRLHYSRQLKDYKSGVAYPTDCYDDVEDLNHYALIVGHGKDYWIIRNTFGEEYGEKGHLLLEKGTCGVGLLVWAIKLGSTT